MKLIDADMEVTAQLFDDMYEEYREEKMPISAFLDLYTNEGCPSAEPKQGEWIYCEDDEGQDGYRCSECGFFVPWYYGHEDINYIYKYHACPSCMAMMKGAD